MVLSFKYPGRVIPAADDDWLVVIWNMMKTRAVWRRMSSILRREGARPRLSGFFFKSIIQSVLLFGAGMWVVTPRMGQVLGSFQDQVARRLTGRLTRWRSEGRFNYTSVEVAREEAEFYPMETYILPKHNTVVQYIVMWLIMDLCEAAERKRGEWGGGGCGGGNSCYLTCRGQGTFYL